MVKIQCTGVGPIHCPVFVNLPLATGNQKKPFVVVVVVVVLLFYVHGKHLRSCRDGQLT